MRVPRMTTRRWALVVAVLSLILGAEAAYRRWATTSKVYRAKARVAAVRAILVECEVVDDSFVRRSSPRPDPDDPRDGDRRARWDRLIAHHRALQEKYDRIASRPWLPIEPDPPEPK
jgi:hypothetical protein